MYTIIHVPVSVLFQILFWFRVLCNIEQRSLGYTVDPCWLSILFYFFPWTLLYFFYFYFYFILLYNTVLVLPYIDMNPPRVCMSSQTWNPLPPPTPYRLSGSSPCTSPKHPVSFIKHRLAIWKEVKMNQSKLHELKGTLPKDDTEHISVWF